MTGSDLKKIRNKTGLNQTKFASELAINGIGQAQISKMESGKMEIPESLLAELQLRGWALDPTDGPEWMVQHGEEGIFFVFHLHPERFSARVMDEPGEGCFTDPESGVTVGEFDWPDEKPDRIRIAELSARACAIWAAYAAVEDGID